MRLNNSLARTREARRNDRLGSSPGGRGELAFPLLPPVILLANSKEVIDFAWFVFGFFGFLFVVHGIYAFTLPSVEPTHWDEIASSQKTILYIAENFRWVGMLLAMFGVLPFAVAYGGLRRGMRWAWLATVRYFKLGSGGLRIPGVSPRLTGEVDCFGL